MKFRLTFFILTASIGFLLALEDGPEEVKTTELVPIQSTAASSTNKTYEIKEIPSKVNAEANNTEKQTIEIVKTLSINNKSEAKSNENEQKNSKESSTTSPSTTTVPSKKKSNALQRYMYHLRTKRRRHHPLRKFVLGRIGLLRRREINSNNVFYFHDGIHHHYHYHIEYKYPREYDHPSYQRYKRLINGQRHYFHHYYHMHKRYRQRRPNNMFFFRGGLHKHHYRYERIRRLPSFGRMLILRAKRLSLDKLRPKNRHPYHKKRFNNHQNRDNL